MNLQPYLFYSVVELADDSGPFFLEQDDSFDGEYNALYQTDDLILGATALKTIWYDFEKESFFESFVELDPLQLYGCISVMLVMGGAAIVWLANSTGCEAVVDMRCKSTDVNRINPEWEAERVRLLKLYKRNRELYSRESAEMLKATQMQMKKYNYRYNFMVRGEEELDLTLIKEFLSDGSMHQMDEDTFLNYFDRARPSKIELGWSVGDDNYSAYFFLQDVEQADVFNRFYGIHNDVMSDYIFNIDVEAKAYSLSLFRQGLKEPVVIPESAYQLIVFKNKFEDYKSGNYNQPLGAWMW